MPDLPLSRPATPPRWASALGHRIVTLLWVKVPGVTAFNWVFFIGYFHLLRNPAYPVMQMPLTPVDHAVPLQPGWLAAYMSLWFYIGIAPGLMLRFRELVVYGCWAAALCATGLACFYFWPTAVPPPPPVDLARWPAFALLQGVDAPGNACPSLHVATAAFTAAWVQRLLGEAGAPGWLKAVNALWFLAIAYSTLAVKQHVFLDVLAGLALGGAFAWVSLKVRAPQPGGPNDPAPGYIIRA